MRKNFKRIVPVMLCAAVVLGLLTASLAAAKTVRQLTAEYSGIQITLDGKTVVPKDVNGSPVDPFIVDGTTYLPVRALANALGLDVDWEQSTQTVILTSKRDTSDYRSKLVGSWSTRETSDTDFIFQDDGTMQVLVAASSGAAGQSPKLTYAKYRWSLADNMLVVTGDKLLTPDGVNETAEIEIRELNDDYLILTMPIQGLVLLYRQK